MTQRVYRVDDLPKGGIDASAAFHADHLGEVRSVLAAADCSALVIVLPIAGTDHDDWRTALAGDLARDATPKRVNIVAGDAVDCVLDYLEIAPGVTGQYLPQRAGEAAG